MDPVEMEKVNTLARQTQVLRNFVQGVSAQDQCLNVHTGI